MTGCGEGWCVANLDLEFRGTVPGIEFCGSGGGWNVVTFGCRTGICENGDEWQSGCVWECGLCSVVGWCVGVGVWRLFGWAVCGGV